MITVDDEYIKQHPTVKLFVDEYNELTKKHNFQLIAALNTSPQGIIPILSIMEIPSPKVETPKVETTS